MNVEKVIMGVISDVVSVKDVLGGDVLWVYLWV